MGVFTFIVVVLVILAIIGGGASAFFGDVSQGIKTSLTFVESSPTLKNFSSKAQNFAQEQVSNVVKEMG
jgi:hypothetical protein